MSDIVVDSSVVAKWILPEADSAKAQRLITQASTDGHRLIVLDLVFAEVANAIWKRQRQHLITPKEATAFLNSLRNIPVRVEPAIPLLPSAFDIAVRFDRAVYDALFVSLAATKGARGITADEPLFNATHVDFPQIVLLRNL
jgi:predicted nucleic acid-binding protein